MGWRSRTVCSRASVSARRGAHERRLDDTGMDRVDPDPAPAQLERGGPRHARHGELARRVAGHAGDADQTVDRRDVHDRAAPARRQRRHDGAYPEVDAAQVRRENPVVLLGALVLDAARWEPDPGVVDQHVDAPERRDGLLDGGGPLGRVGDVERNEHARVTQVGGDGAPARFVDVGHDDRGALCREQPGLGGALPARRPGDQRDLRLESTRHASPSRNARAAGEGPPPLARAPPGRVGRAGILVVRRLTPAARWERSCSRSSGCRAAPARRPRCRHACR